MDGKRRYGGGYPEVVPKNELRVLRYFCDEGHVSDKEASVRARWPASVRWMQGSMTSARLVTVARVYGFYSSIKPTSKLFC